MIKLTEKSANVINSMIGDRKGYGLRLATIDDCCGVKFNLFFDKKSASDKTVKRHGNIHIFSDRQTLGLAAALEKKKQFVKTTVDYISTPLTNGFISNNQRLNLNIWEHELV